MEEIVKNVYFLSDAHLGSRAIPHGRTQERRLVNFSNRSFFTTKAIFSSGPKTDLKAEGKIILPLSSIFTLYSPMNFAIFLLCIIHLRSLQN